VPSVAYQLEIDGTPAAPDLLAAVLGIEVEDHAELASMLRLRIAAGQAPDGADWRFVGDPLFARLANVRLSVTIGSGDAELIFDGYIVETGADIEHDPGASVVEVVAMDATVLMDLEEKVRAWPNESDSGVVEAIFGEYGLTPDVEATEPTREEDDVVAIQRATDMQYVRELARRNGFECYVDVASGSAEGHFHAPRLDEEPQGVLSVRSGAASNVDAFSVRYDMIAPTAASAAALGALDLSDQTAEIESANLTALGSDAVHDAGNGRAVLLSRTGLVDTAALERAAQGVVDRSSWAIRATGELGTITYGKVLRAKRPVSVRGVGQVFSGIYYVEKVLHVIDGDGYRQRFALRRNAIGLTGSESFSDDGGLA